ncbi:11030_t:CDS:2 [Diversispora eburnea]|uniref:11030_t:CDS:1 n=1 Tax=Diversispora eburnea TaxID=1213867 RepID=A0A9N8V048_9GLOM|nr:11030_t:CDS:2 [Diversispora eburnea]
MDVNSICCSLPPLERKSFEFSSSDNYSSRSLPSPPIMEKNLPPLNSILSAPSIHNAGNNTTLTNHKPTTPTHNPPPPYISEPSRNHSYPTLNQVENNYQHHHYQNYSEPRISLDGIPPPPGRSQISSPTSQHSGSNYSLSDHLPSHYGGRSNIESPYVIDHCNQISQFVFQYREARMSSNSWQINETELTSMINRTYDVLNILSGLKGELTSQAATNENSQDEELDLSRKRSSNMQQRTKYRKRSKRAAPPGRCHSCNISETPEWRRGPDGARTLCNACGLHKKCIYRIVILPEEVLTTLSDPLKFIKLIGIIGITENSNK